MYTYINTYIYTYINYIHKYMHTYIYAYIHTVHTHTHRQNSFPLVQPLQERLPVAVFMNFTTRRKSQTVKDVHLWQLPKW